MLCNFTKSKISKITAVILVLVMIVCVTVSYDFSGIAYAAVLFPPDTYTLTTDCWEGGTIKPSGETMVEYDEDATDEHKVILTVTPDDGYEILSFRVDDVECLGTLEETADGSYQYALETVTDNVAVEAAFEAVQPEEATDPMDNDCYRITFSETPVVYDNTYVVSAGASMTMTPKTPYTSVKVGKNQSGNTITFTKTTEISTLLLAKIKNGWASKNGGKSVLAEIHFIVDETAPEFETITTEPDSDYYNDAYRVEVLVTDAEAGVDKVWYSVENDLSTARAAEYDEQSGAYQFKTGAGEFGDNYYIWAVDKVGNVNSTSIPIAIDKTAPEVIGFSFDGLKNSYEYGSFSNTDVMVTVTAADESSTIMNSGVGEILLYADGVEIDSASVTTNGEAVFTLTEEMFAETKELSAAAIDKAGNASEAFYPNTENSNALSAKITISTQQSEIAIANAGDAYVKENGEYWYAGDNAFTVKLEDPFGMKSVVITMNGKTVITEENLAKEGAPLTSMEYTISTSGNALDGKNEIVVTGVNICGVITKNSGTSYIDSVNPNIAGVYFEPRMYIEGNEDKPVVEVTDYGFYFKEDAIVTVYAQDIAPSSGIKSITYYTVDVSMPKDQKPTLQTAYVDKDDKITFVIKANFKGQIYAKATDNVGNTTESFVSPDRAILETLAKHNSEEHIRFEKAETSSKTADNTELYSNDVPVTLTISDTYSGIREIEWSVTAPYDTGNNQGGRVTLQNDKTVEAGSETDWQKTKTEANLVTEMKKTVTVRNNSNNIIVNVKMTDRSGNTSEEKVELSIDKTAPTIKVEYDNDTPDEAYTDIYKEDRTATITVTERNFRAENVICVITNTDTMIPAINGWTEYKNTTNPDETYYTATIVYSADGDYTFDIGCTDLAGNVTEKFEPHRFTIDKTKPVLSVSYNNHDVINGNYYADSRVATITVVEHNFDPSRITVIGSATDNGAVTSFPGLGAWSDRGDVHTATLNYSNDAKYSFDVECMDMAGNSIDDFMPEEFYVDKTAPVLEITGVYDLSANNGVVAPVVTCSDTNSDRETLRVVLTGINNGAVDYAGVFENMANGARYTYDDFETLKQVDDIYTLTAAVRDLAGNETTQTITFSVNRFGSVYDLTKAADIMGKFLNAERDIVFVETNVDSLTRDTIKLKLIKNGVPTDLVEGLDYTIEATGGNGNWSQYQYTLKKELFADDGRYSITIYSVDAAGNINENIDESKDAEISFGIDKTMPVVVPIDFESGKQYAVALKTVSVEIKDNLVLQGVKVYLNEKEIEYQADGETYTFDVLESNKKQSVRVAAVDAAGNEYEVIIKEFLVSTNAFVRWYNNTPLFVGSIAGGALLVFLFIFFLLFGRKKK